MNNHDKLLYALQRLIGSGFHITGKEVFYDEGVEAPTQAEIDAEIAKIESGVYEIGQWRSTAYLTRRKFMLGIKFYPHGEGTLEDAINTLREGLQEPDKTVIGISLDESTHFNRSDQDLIAMATAIGMTAEQVDEFYKWAENEDWRNA